MRLRSVNIEQSHVSVQTLTMTAERWIYSLALCFMCVSSNEDYFDGNCETQMLGAHLGYSVCLPCTLEGSHDWVSWVQNIELPLVELNSKGLIKFLDPRHGRVKAFPNQGSKGNYSICIDELQDSDLGYYRCKQGYECVQVELTATGLSKTELLIFGCAGIAACILLSTWCFCCIKCISYCNNKTNDYENSPVGAHTGGASAPPQEADMGPGDLGQQGAVNPVYENDEHDPAYAQGDPTRHNNHLPGYTYYMDRTQPTPSTSGIYPNLNQFDVETTEIKKTKMRFHRELISRMRHASFGRYYVNQSEVNRQGAASSQVEKQHKGFRKNKPKESEC